MKIMSSMQKINDLTKSTKDKQSLITVSEAWHLWGHLKDRYSVVYTTQILLNFAEDNDLKLVLKQGIKALQKQIIELENLSGEYGITLPRKPPAESNSTVPIEGIDDIYIFRRVFRGIQAFVPVHTEAFLTSTTTKVRQKFKQYLIEELDIYDKFVEYGKLKGFIFKPPAFRA